ncbi:MAG: hypothetical protein BroJett031_06710 [Betaproteobacteria bacterium]|nr:MAG: hypothetical protein BroJett031_06710 [Betaproteobacteria bacterium]
MINLQQCRLEQYLVERTQELPAIDLRWRNKVIPVRPRDDAVALTAETREGNYQLAADWPIAVDGALGPVRRKPGLEIQGRVFTERFSIAALPPRPRARAAARQPHHLAVLREAMQQAREGVSLPPNAQKRR